MAEVPEIIEFLKEKTGTDDITDNSDIANDMGVDGVGSPFLVQLKSRIFYHFNNQFTSFCWA